MCFIPTRCATLRVLVEETKTPRAAQAQPSSPAAAHGAEGFILQQPCMGSAPCSGWRRARRCSWSAWDGEGEWTMVAVPCLMNSQACFPSSPPCHHAPKANQRDGKSKDKAGNVSRARGALRASQMAGATRLGTCPVYGEASGALFSAALPASVPIQGHARDPQPSPPARSGPPHSPSRACCKWERRDEEEAP